jgi:hypothetical protein
MAMILISLAPFADANVELVEHSDSSTNAAIATHVGKIDIHDNIPQDFAAIPLLESATQRLARIALLKHTPPQSTRIEDTEEGFYDLANCDWFAACPDKFPVSVT